MKRKALYISLLLSAFSFLNTYGQESLSGLQVNPILQQKAKSKKTFKADVSKSVFELPFITDFAKEVGYPDTAYWVDDFAFINLNYPLDPPSIGVATLDAIDETGKLYTNASSLPFPADTLTSKIINLNYPVDDSVYISFYYEPGGLGDTPEINDSLLLDYYSEDSSRWYNVWNVRFNNVDTVLYEYHLHNDSTYIIRKDSVNLSEIFQQVVLPVNNEIFLNDTFQFRFRNYASITASADVEGSMGNSDHWHVDYIRLDTGRTINDTISKDASIVTPIRSFLRDYNAIPHEHYGQILINAIKDSTYLSFANLYDNTFVWGLDYVIEDMNGPYSKTIIGQEGDDISPNDNIEYGLELNYEFPFDPFTDSSLFRLRGILDIDDAQDDVYRWNDTTTFYQKFYNYYAYDDGTAENGYGIIGEGTENAMVAMRFDTYMEDTIRGIQIYFNQTKPSTNTKYFKIQVWNDDNGIPGNIVHTSSIQVRPTDQGLNEFTLIKFDEIVEVGEVFYIGWQKQNLTDMLNVGFDINRVNNDKVFYKFASGWNESELKGTIMIRPVLGKTLDIINSTTKLNEQEIKLTIYPNPANNYLTVDIQDYTDSDYQYEIFDSFGRIHQNNVSANSPIDISNLSPGVYFIRISYPGKQAATRKFIIIR